MNQNTLKQMVAEAALDFIKPDFIVGIGTGTTTNYFIDKLATMRGQIKGTVASSQASAQRLQAHNIPVFELNDVSEIEVYIDGCDESDKFLHLIKGGGGALTREKILVANAKKFVCIADQSKLVSTLGNFPLPIEVIPIARSYVAREIFKTTGGEPVWRKDYITDNGNQILDIHGLDIVDPKALESKINQIVGVVTNGLFALRSADILLIAEPEGIQEIHS